MFKWQGISKIDTQLLKGGGILLIIFHNLFHAFHYWNIENEFDFKPERLAYFLNHFNDDLFSFTGLSFAYFGHYGVQIFIFLSAYGLYVSSRKKTEPYWGFIKNRIRKLYPTFVMAVLLFLVLHLIISGGYNFQQLLLSVFLKLSFTSNFFPHESFQPCGPWWFYSMIVQFYLLFPFLYKLFNKYGHLPFILLSLIIWMVEYHFNAALIDAGWFLNTLVIGHIPVIYLGMAATQLKQGHKNNSWLCALAALLLFYVGNKYALWWFFANIAATVLLLYVYFLLKQIPIKKGVLKKIFLFYGTISMYLFAVNGFLRHPFLLAILRADNIWIKWAIVSAFIIFVTMVAVILWKIETLLFKKVMAWFRQQKPVLNNKSC